MQRYFATISNKEVSLSKEDSFHLIKVMRAKDNDHIEVVDSNTHQAYLAIINQISPLKISIVEPIIKNNELEKDVTLFFALAKSDKIELVIQKATELGAKRVILFQGQRSVVKYSLDDFNRKLTRFLAIAKEASEQCHREYIPDIAFLKSIDEVKNNLSDLNLFAYELDAGKTDKLENLLNQNNYQSVSIIVGPEGGFSKEEADKLNEFGFKNVSLGKRILRCETAAIYALSIIAFKMEQQ